MGGWGIPASTVVVLVLVVDDNLCVLFLSLGSSQDHEKELAALFQLWLETKDQAFFKVRPIFISSGTSPAG